MREILLLAIFLAPGLAPAQTAPSSFTYQGQLTEAGQPATGLFDLQFCLFDTEGPGPELSCAPEFADWPVEAGLFTVALDFGAAVFDGSPRFLEIRVRPAESGGPYTVLLPRQAVRPTPESLRAATAASASWSGLTGIPEGFADGIDNDSGGTVTRVSAGSGLSGGDITTSGTLAIAEGGVGLAQINTAEVQARISSLCATGHYLRGVEPDGAPICEALPSASAGNSIVTIADQVGTASTINGLTAVAAGDDGLPLVAYKDSSWNELRLASCANPNCSSLKWVRTIDASQGGTVGDMKLGADGLPLLSYFGLNNGAIQGRIAKCNDATCSTPTISLLDPNGNGRGGDSSIVIPGDGLPLIAYTDESSQSIAVMKCADIGCTSSSSRVNVSGACQSPFTVDMVQGADGLPVLAYYCLGGGGQLRISKCDNSSCSGAITSTLLDAGGSYGHYLSMALGSDGLPLVAYTGNSAGDDRLKLSKCLSADCSNFSTHVLADPSPLGANVSAVLGSQGFPLISHADLRYRTLRLVVCHSHDCTQNELLQLDAAGDAGMASSITLLPDGRPVVSYGENEARAVKLFICGSQDCT